MRLIHSKGANFARYMNVPAWSFALLLMGCSSGEDPGTMAVAVEQPASAAETVAGMAESAMGAAADMAESVMPGAAAPAGDTAKGKAVYDSACFACHMTGAAGAPKLGDKALWGPRIAQGMDVLYTTALNGKGAMPPRGGRMDLSDADVKAAVDYMVEQAR